MLKIRIIPILTFNGFALVKTQRFSNPRMVGNPIQAARVFNSRNVDELVFTDITATYQNRKINLPFVKEVIDQCFMPVTIGGGIKNLDDINDLLKIGADKVLLKNSFIQQPSFVGEAAKIYGSQCITVAVDAYWNEERKAYLLHNKEGVVLDAAAFASMAEKEGAGEIILSSVDRDGMRNGFDINLVRQIMAAVKIPVVAVGGGGTPEHYLELFRDTDVKAAGGAAIYYFTQFTSYDIKKLLAENGFPARVIPNSTGDNFMKLG
jgi:imidazole glycerol-phosphate synthase subunit HisF